MPHLHVASPVPVQLDTSYSSSYICHTPQCEPMTGLFSSAMRKNQLGTSAKEWLNGYYI